MKIKNTNKRNCKSTFKAPKKHKPIVCKKCNMTNVYMIDKCCFCSEPFKTTAT